MFVGPVTLVKNTMDIDYEILHCSRCGISEQDEPNNYLTDCTVIIADDEEGFAYITQYFCGVCLCKLQLELTRIGFKDHRHGGINYLEDLECIGASHSEFCPMPSEYGHYIVQ